jgi:hypothetical protein
MIRWPSLRSALRSLLTPSPSSFSTRAIAWEHLRALRLLKDAETRAREAEVKLLVVTAERDDLLHASAVQSTRDTVPGPPRLRDWDYDEHD